jgi:hypothetical protein
MAVFYNIFKELIPIFSNCSKKSKREEYFLLFFGGGTRV